MPSVEFNNNAKDVAGEVIRTRVAMCRRIGEVISAIIGDAKLQKMFETQAVPENLKGKPSGEIALALNLITPEVKTALLVAQAAERTLALAERTEIFLKIREVIRISLTQAVEQVENEKKDEIIQEKKEKRGGLSKFLHLGVDLGGMDRTEIEMAGQQARKNFSDTYGYVALDNPVFKYVGSERDPDVLKAAQAAWVAAQMYMNNEIDAVTYHSIFPLEEGVTSVGGNFVDGLKKKAAEGYAYAADVLMAARYEEVSDRLAAVAKWITITIENYNAPNPKDLVQKLFAEEAWKVQMTNQTFADWTSITVGARTGLEKESCDRIIALLNLGDKKAPAPKPNAKIVGGPGYPLI